MGTLDGKVALITGAARGQGRAHVQRLASDGADIVALDLCEQIDTVPYPMATEADLNETVGIAEREGRRVLASKTDVRDLAALRDVAKKAVAEFGHIDIVVANAGIMPTIGAHADEDQAFYDAIDVMLNGVWHTIRATVPTMVEQGLGGSIVLTSSTAGIKGLYTDKEAGAGYVAAKHGVVGLMRMYANYLAPHRIRVNTVHPTGVNSPMVANQAFAEYATEHPEIAGMLQNTLPVSLIEPEDVSAAVAWLVSDQARYVTGVALPVDAGFLNRP